MRLCMPLSVWVLSVMDVSGDGQGGVLWAIGHRPVIGATLTEGGCFLSTSPNTGIT